MDTDESLTTRPTQHRHTKQEIFVNKPYFALVTKIAKLYLFFVFFYPPMPPSSESNIKVLKINLLLHVLSSTMDGEISYCNWQKG